MPTDLDAYRGLRTIYMALLAYMAGLCSTLTRMLSRLSTKLRSSQVQSRIDRPHADRPDDEQLREWHPGWILGQPKAYYAVRSMYFVLNIACKVVLRQEQNEAQLQPSAYQPGGPGKLWDNYSA